MKNVGIQEFKDNALDYLASDEILAVKRQGQVVGFYIPVTQDDRQSLQQKLLLLSKSVDEALAESGLSEEALSQALNLSIKE